MPRSGVGVLVLTASGDGNTALLLTASAERAGPGRGRPIAAIRERAGRIGTRRGAVADKEAAE